jgi:hypothetical protein
LGSWRKWSETETERDSAVEWRGRKRERKKSSKWWRDPIGGAARRRKEVRIGFKETKEL